VSTTVRLPESDSHASPERYAAGDVLEIRPQNQAEDVEDFLKSAGWLDLADDLFDIEPSNPRQFAMDVVSPCT
jgi:sulfite reductase alpha subunit-like flavoprotein